MMKDKKKTPGNRDDAPGKRGNMKILFHIVTRMKGKRQEYRLSWGER